MQERDALAGKDGNRATIFRCKGVVQKSRVAEQFRLRIMDYDTYFREHLEALHREGRYRVFADLKRRCGAYPTAEHFAESGTRDVTVWLSLIHISEPTRLL